jgi:Tripartite tricarboxylate transporter family receptor
MPPVREARELGLDILLEAWRGIAVPQGTPKAAVDRFEAAIKSTVESLKFVRACIRLGAQPAFLPADKFRRRIAEQDAKPAQLMEIMRLKTWGSRSDMRALSGAAERLLLNGFTSHIRSRSSATTGVQGRGALHSFSPCGRRAR